jgi:hypothetical protein
MRDPLMQNGRPNRGGHSHFNTGFVISRGADDLARFPSRHKRHENGARHDPPVSAHAPSRPANT